MLFLERKFGFPSRSNAETDVDVLDLSQWHNAPVLSSKEMIMVFLGAKTPRNLALHRVCRYFAIHL
jgi:hypothetical protein